MGQKLYIGNLGFDVTKDELEAVFTAIGTCDSVAVITDRDTGQNRGFGFVEMASKADAQKAIQQLDGTDLKGRAMKVSEARDRAANGGGGGGAGGNGRGTWNRW